MLCSLDEMNNRKWGEGWSECVVNKVDLSLCCTKDLKLLCHKLGHSRRSSAYAYVKGTNVVAGSVEDEFGDIMFCLVNVARHSGFNADVALRRANAKFEKRFREVERLAREQGKELPEFGLEGLQQLWKQAKNSTK